jgi:hypothetical protein
MFEAGAQRQIQGTLMSRYMKIVVVAASAVMALSACDGEVQPQGSSQSRGSYGGPQAPVAAPDESDEGGQAAAPEQWQVPPIQLPPAPPDNDDLAAPLPEAPGQGEPQAPPPAAPPEPPATTAPPEPSAPSASGPAVDSDGRHHPHQVEPGPASTESPSP